MIDEHCTGLSLEFNRHITNLLDSLSALSELAGLSINDFDEGRLLKQALEALMSNQDMERCSIFLLDDGGFLRNAAGLDWNEMLLGLGHAGAPDPARGVPSQYRLGEGLMGHAAESGTIEHCRSCAEDPRFSDFGNKPVNGALICVPVQCEGKVLGVLNVFHPEPGFFNLWHERLLLLFTQVLGRLLLNHRLTHSLGSMLDDKTREVMAANVSLRAEAASLQRAQEKIAEQHRFLKSVMDSAPEPIMVIGLDYRLLMANEPARKLAEAVGGDQPMTCHKLSHRRDTPCDGVEHQCPLKMVLARDGPVTVLHEHYDAKGQPRQIELLASPLRDNAGAIIGIIESARDVTERKQAEQEYRALLQTTTDGYLAVDNDGRVVDTNDAYCDMLGYSRNELLRMRVADLDAIQSPDEIAQHGDAIRGRGHQRFETRHRCKDGRILDVEISATWLNIRGSMTIAFVRDITERKETDLRIRQLAYFDSLTNLPNRRLLLDRLEHALAQAKRFQRALAVMFLDLDRFKQINDTLGHDAGDQLLKQVAGRLSACVRAGDTVSRQGGDEFVVLLAELVHPEDAALVAEKMLARLAEPVDVAGQSLSVTVSIGIAVNPPEGGDDARELMKKADAAMYQAKEAGRNGYRFYRD